MPDVTVVPLEDNVACSQSKECKQASFQAMLSSFLQLEQKVADPIKTVPGRDCCQAFAKEVQVLAIGPLARLLLVCRH